MFPWWWHLAIHIELSTETFVPQFSLEYWSVNFILLGIYTNFKTFKVVFNFHWILFNSLDLRSNFWWSVFRRHVLDALPMLGSNAAIAVMKDIILKNSVSQDVAHEWLLALSFIPRYVLEWNNGVEPPLTCSVTHIGHNFLALLQVSLVGEYVHWFV